MVKSPRVGRKVTLIMVSEVTYSRHMMMASKVSYSREKGNPGNGKVS